MICARKKRRSVRTLQQHEVHHVRAHLHVPPAARGLMLIVNDGDRRVPRLLERAVNDRLQHDLWATCQVGLLEAAEARVPQRLRDREFLAARLMGVVEYLADRPELAQLPMVLLGTDAAGAAVLLVAAQRPPQLAAAVCVAASDLARLEEAAAIEVPTLLVVPGNHRQLVCEHEALFWSLHCASQLAVVRGASRWFSEPGTLAAAASAVLDWCALHVAQGAPSTPNASDREELYEPRPCAAAAAVC